MSGTPREMASKEKLAAHPYEHIPEAFATKIPAATIETVQTNSNIFLRVNFILFFGYIFIT